MKKIKIEDYNPKWAHAFNELKKALQEHVSKTLVIEHVGSTSVPGLAAKPIIDIDIIVKSKKDVTKLIDSLEALGYIYKGDMGIEGREVFLRSINDVPLLKEHHSKWFAHHLYVCIEGSLPLRNHLALREYLMAHEEAVIEYGELKKALAHKYPHDMDKYIEEKTPFITRILKSEGFSEEDIKQVEKDNE